MRYGDDFIIFTSTRRKAFEYQRQSVDFLHENLKLQINPKNDIIFQSSDGMRFLGHDVSFGEIVVDNHTTKSVLSQISQQNIASYKSLLLNQAAKKELDWLLIQQIDKIFDTNSII